MNFPPPIPKSETAPSINLQQLFPAHLFDWLRRRGCLAAYWAPPDGQPAAGERTGAVRRGVELCWIMASLPSPANELRLRFAAPDSLTEAELQALSAYLASLDPFLRESGTVAASGSLCIDRDTLVAMEHQLRNHLNSLLMNASALVLQFGRHEDLDRYVDQMQSDGDKCASVLHWLAGLRS